MRAPRFTAIFERYIGRLKTVLEHSLRERDREHQRRRGRGTKKGGGKISPGDCGTRFKVGTVAFSKKLGLILFLPGSSQHEKPCSLFTFGLEPMESFEK
jgi:hypothetical protein